MRGRRLAPTLPTSVGRRRRPDVWDPVAVCMTPVAYSWPLIPNAQLAAGVEKASACDEQKEAGVDRREATRSTDDATSEHIRDERVQRGASTLRGPGAAACRHVPCPYRTHQDRCASPSPRRSNVSQRERTTSTWRHRRHASHPVRTRTTILTTAMAAAHGPEEGLAPPQQARSMPL